MITFINYPEIIKIRGIAAKNLYIDNIMIAHQQVIFLLRHILIDVVCRYVEI